jgi:hypothetical protein
MRQENRGVEPWYFVDFSTTSLQTTNSIMSVALDKMGIATQKVTTKPCHAS